MSDREKLSVNKNNMRVLASVFAFLLCLLMFTSCSSMTEAEKKVSKELKALQSSDSVGSEVINLRNSLSEAGREDFDGFLEKLRDFDFEITGSKEDSGKDNNYTLVSVRIKSYDFGREYLAVWTEYLKTHKEKPVDDDLTAFYELLFERLNELDEKDCIKDIEIVCIDPLDNGEWVADIKDNEELQDAVFGGMLSEMKSLAAE